MESVDASMVHIASTHMNITVSVVLKVRKNCLTNVAFIFKWIIFYELFLLANIGRERGGKV